MARRRYLHVPAEYAEYAYLNPSVVLHETRTKLLQEYKERAEATMNVGGAIVGGHGSAGAALEIQNFLQALKQYGNTGAMSDDLMASVEMETIQNTVMAALGGRYKHIFQTMYFRKSEIRKQGIAFENQLSQIIAIINAMVSGENFMDRKIINKRAKAIGTGTSGVSLYDVVDQDYVKPMLKNMKNGMNEQFNMPKKQSPWTTKKPVEGKADATGKTIEWKINNEASPYLKRIANLLSQAAFTGKSYRSVSQIYENNIKKFVDKEFDKLKFKLGDTDMNRIMTDIFNSVGYPSTVSIALVFALNNKAKYNEQVKSDLATLRFIYELTGRGQTYVNDIIRQTFAENDINMGANYLVFNDPATNEIYVRSTADIITEMHNQMSKIFNAKLYMLRKDVFGSR